MKKQPSNNLSYKEIKASEDFKKAKEILKKLPFYCQAYFSSIKSKSGGTAYLYMRNILSFYEYLEESNPEFKKKGIKEISLENLDGLNRQDIEDFLNSLYNSKLGDFDIPQRNNTKRIYISALTSFFGYWEDEGELAQNILLKIPKNKKERKRGVTRLDYEEEKGMLDSVLYGTGLTPKQAQFAEKSRLRDYAICLMLLRTGIRVSELVGLNIEDLSYKKNSIMVARKESMLKDDEVFFDDDVADALKNYLGEKNATNTSRGTPLFTVSQGKYKGDRLSVRSVENLVYKYSTAGAGRRMSPHKLRATFATNMITATGNIELVKEQMGHADISTTTIYIDDAALAKANARNVLKERKEAIESGEIESDNATINKKNS